MFVRWFHNFQESLKEVSRSEVLLSLQLSYSEAIFQTEFIESAVDRKAETRSLNDLTAGFCMFLFCCMFEIDFQPSRHPRLSINFVHSHRSAMQLHARAVLIRLRVCSQQL